MALDIEEFRSPHGGSRTQQICELVWPGHHLEIQRHDNYAYRQVQQVPLPSHGKHANRQAQAAIWWCWGLLANVQTGAQGRRWWRCNMAGMPAGVNRCYQANKAKGHGQAGESWCWDRRTGQQAILPHCVANLGHSRHLKGWGNTCSGM